jgi:hypothetical protein
LLRGHIDDGEIRGAKSQIEGCKAQVEAAKGWVAAKDERLLLAHDRQEELTRRLTEATDKIIQLQNRMCDDGEALKVAQAALLAINNATTANTALGSSLAIGSHDQWFINSPSPALATPTDQSSATRESGRFKIYGLTHGSGDHPSS